MTSAPAATGPAPLDRRARDAFARGAGVAAIEYEGRWYDWGELAEVCTALDEALIACGVAPDAPVMFAPRNRPAAVAAFLGLIAQNRNIRMIYAFQGPVAIAADIKRLRPSVIVGMAGDFDDDVCAGMAAAGTAGIMLKDMTVEAVPGHIRSSAPAEHIEGPRRIEILTSGTTGRPKHFPIYFKMIADHLLGGGGGTGAWRPAAGPDAPPVLLVSPMANISGISTFLPTLLSGQRGILRDRFSVADWHAYVLRFRPTAASMVPAGIQMILDADIPPEDLASIEVMGAGAAPLEPHVQRAFEARYGIPLLQSYGATEFGGPVASMTLDHRRDFGDAKIGSVGRPLAGVKLRVVDPDSGAELPAGQQGLLDVISPRIGEEWIRTADLAIIDEDGFVFHRGRADGAIMRGGFKLLPETIENALHQHPAIAIAAATGIPDKRLGEVPVVAIQVEKDAAPPSIEELEAHLRDRVLSTHMPVHWRIVEALPRTPSMKVDRPAIRRFFTEN